MSRPPSRRDDGPHRSEMAERFGCAGSAVLTWVLAATSQPADHDRIRHDPGRRPAAPALAATIGSTAVAQPQSCAKHSAIRPGSSL